MGLGLVLLTAAVLVFITVPSWGRWIEAYPMQAAQVIPEQAQGMLLVFGPLLEQAGGYMQAAGYFAGSLLGIISLIPLSAGIMITRASSTPA